MSRWVQMGTDGYRWVQMGDYLSPRAGTLESTPLGPKLRALLRGRLPGSCLQPDAGYPSEEKQIDWRVRERA